MSDYTISDARYAKRMKAVRIVSSGDGWKTRADRLAETLANGRYTHRERAYIMSPRRAAKFEELYAAGWDASFITRELQEPKS